MISTSENVGLNDAIDALESLDNYRNWMLEEFGPYLSGEVVEIGAGSGSLSEKLLPYSTTLDLVEPSSELIGRLQNRVAAHENISIFNQPAEEWLQQVKTESKDSIVMVNVLEHIQDDLASLKQMWRALHADGSLLLYVPALNFLFSKLDEEHGHFRRYSKSGLKSKVAAAGFKIVKARYVDLLGILPWRVFNKWLKKTEFNPAMVQLYDRFGNPTTKMVEKFSGAPIGKNILLVAKKPV